MKWLTKLLKCGSCSPYGVLVNIVFWSIVEGIAYYILSSGMTSIMKNRSKEFGKP